MYVCMYVEYACVRASVYGEAETKVNKRFGWLAIILVFILITGPIMAAFTTNL